MKVKEAMTSQCEFIEPDDNLQQAAQKMRDLNCGFLPIVRPATGALEGVITDRDIVVRAVADGCHPTETLLNQIETPNVLYCYAEDGVESAADKMSEQGVYRLIVLDSPETKRLCGVISLGDILRHNEEILAAETSRNIMINAA